MSADIQHQDDDDALPMPDPDAGESLFGDDAQAPQTTAPASQESYQVLARKYRPEFFRDLIGQDVMVQTLRNSFALGRVAHAFMLTGIRGVGKTTTARIIARALNCTGRKDPHDVEPCGVCANCVAIAQGRHPDVIEMDAASKTGVDDVREIIESAQFRPLMGRKKVFIIDEVHMLSRNAFNSLLKTLEEPPEHVVFIFATTELRKVPITVISRCQRFDLLRVPQDKLVDYFSHVAKKEGAHIAKGALALIARAAQGSVRDGLSLLDQAFVQSDHDRDIGEEDVREMLGVADGATLISLFEAAMKGQPQHMLGIMDKAWREGMDCALIIKDLLGLIHDLCCAKALGNVQDVDAVSTVDDTRLASLGEKLDVPILMRAWQLLLKGLSEVEQAPDRRGAADMVMIRLCFVADLPSPAQAVAQLAGGHEGPPIQHKPTEEKIAGPSETHRAQSKKKIEIHNWRDIVSLARIHHWPRLHAQLRLNVHPISLGEGEIVIRPDEKLSGDQICRDIKTLIDKATGQDWRVRLGEAQGAPTLAQQGAQEEEKRHQEAQNHPLVRAALEIFPDAKLASIVDHKLDYYGLPQQSSS